MQHVIKLIGAIFRHLAFDLMEEELSTACRAAADALGVLSHLRPGFSRNVVPRINPTSVSSSQVSNGERRRSARNLPFILRRRQLSQTVLFKHG